MSLPTDIRYTIDEFRKAVNMTDREIEQWMSSADAKSAPDADEDQRILALLRKSDKDYTDGDIGEMRRVIDVVRQRLTLDAHPVNVENSAWRYALMNWGHDPLKEPQFKSH